jgi:hypothetical protein
MSTGLKIHEPPQVAAGLGEWDTKTSAYVLAMMRHAVGMRDDVRKIRQGYRNRFYSRQGERAHRLWSQLVELGMARKAATIVSGVDLFSLTRDGCEVIGLHEAGIARACQELRGGRPCDDEQEEGGA